MQMPTNIILIGMPAVGKSTVGVLLAKQIGYDFLDTDLIIQSGEKRRLGEIIRQRGMDAFCDLEAGYVQRLCAHHTVIATGGSVIYRHHAMTHLKKIGTLCFLDITIETLKLRLGNIETRGVIRPDGQSIEALYQERGPLYRQYAQATVNCANLSPQEVAAALISACGIANA